MGMMFEQSRRRRVRRGLHDDENGQHIDDVRNAI
jgi:hypothetical protein